MKYEKALEKLHSEQTVLSGEDMRGQVAYVDMLLRDLEPHQIRRNVYAQFGAACSNILRRVETGRCLRDVAPAQRDVMVRGITRLRTTALGVGGPETPENYWCKDALEEAVSPIVQSIIADRTAFKAILEFEYATMPPSHSNRLRRVVKEIHNGLDLTGIELSDSMRNARNEALEFVSAGDRERYPIGWFLLGWLCLHGAFCADAVSHFANGLNVIGKRTDLLAFLLNRYLSIALELSDRHADAYETVKGALALRVDENILLEAARYCARTRHPGEAWRFTEEAIQRRPTTVYAAMAEEDLNSVEGAVLAGYGHALETVRKRAEDACTNWQIAIERAHAAEAKVGTTLELPGDMVSGVSQLRRDLKGADLTEAFGIVTAADYVRKELLELAAKRISTLVANRDADLDEVRRQKAQITARLDGKSERAVQLHEITKRQLSASAHAADPNGEIVAAGYHIAGKSAFLILIAFPIIIRVSAIFGHELSSSSTAMLALALLAVPVLTAMGTQFSLSIRKSAAESESLRQKALMERRYERETNRIEAERAEQNKELENLEATLEARSSVAAEAIRLLQPEVTVDPAASQLAA